MVKAMVSNNTYHLCLVEDDVDVQQALASYLEFEGYETTAIGDGDEALHILRNGTKFDLILLDVMLPSRNGFDVLREARGMGIRTPVVMLTAKDQQDDILRGFELGADQGSRRAANGRSYDRRCIRQLHIE
ncbi:MAG: response regulator [Rhodothermales bacterium]